MGDQVNNDLHSRETGDENIFLPESRLTLDLEPPIGFEHESFLFKGSDFKDRDDLGAPNFLGASEAHSQFQEFPDYYSQEVQVPDLNELFQPVTQPSAPLQIAIPDKLQTPDISLQTLNDAADAGAKETPNLERPIPGDFVAGLKSSVKVVVWSKTKRAASQRSGESGSGHCGSRNLFIVNQAKRKLDAQQSIVPSHDKDKISKKKRQKRVDTAVDSPRNSKSNSKKIGVKTKKGQVKLSKPEKYKRYIQSYISRQECLPKAGETERMKENGDSNLMWLLDFKVDKLFQPPPPALPPQEDNFCSEFENIMADLQSDHPGADSSSFMPTTNLEQPTDQQLELPATITVSNFDPMNPEHAFTVDLEAVDNVANFEQVESESIPIPVVTENSKSESTDHGEQTERLEYTPPEITFDEQGKPRCTYTDLIERALTESGGLTVSEIYQWISDHYPFFRADDDRWKNSVRHNLSINPYFKKGEKARSGAGHLWTISEESRALRPALRKKDSEYEEINMLIENDTDRAVASILGQYNLAKANMNGKVPVEMSPTSKKTTEFTANNEISSASQENVEPVKPTEDAVEPVYLEYDPGSEFSEFTIELNGLNGLSIPDAASFEFQDLLSSGRLIVIQSEDQDSDKENSIRLSDTTLHNLDEYMGNDFSVMHVETPNSTETERVSGQLISEALTQDFDCIKNSEKISNNTETNGYHLSVSQFERLPGCSDSEDFMAMESMDPASLQEVIQNSGHNGESEQFHNILNLTGNPYEPKELEYCEYDHQITL